MIQKSLLHIVTMGFAVIALSACGGKGIDRKLNYSGTETELGESYGKAMADATPEQQNILREHQMIVLSVVSLARNSNPATVDAFVAKKNADEFQRLSKMSVRELLVEKLGKRQNELDSNILVLEQFQNGNALKVENTEIKKIDLHNNGISSSIDLDGVVTVRNDSDGFDYDINECALFLSLDGKQIEENNGSGRCKLQGKVIKSKGGKESFDFDYRILRTEDAQAFNNLLQSGQTQKIKWKFEPSPIYSHIRSNSDENYIISADIRNIKSFKEKLQKITADLAVLKK